MVRLTTGIGHDIWEDGWFWLMTHVTIDVLHTRVVPCEHASTQLGLQVHDSGVMWLTPLLWLGSRN